ncbi:carboxypeptidase-like regulatory domain-containing protein [Dyadobacter sp. CY312]|uniref:carboxypeptidase-like regulatory domain-containing protein n=1 Tax=Dyadobacter sp. CY312 TaxID=2907303 RepID=UPI001F41C7DB|nr:carboxypeptidase-like regulatory domain-containing protein [Dyadobacter sp. CY312]MCE7043728.1 carboxypeptidase-like regulatory domain-containing protein [Dyadobacter sp. CY312]
MIQQYAIILLLLIMPAYGFSQTVSIHGQVLNFSEKGIPFASIQVLGTSEGTVTNDSGFFKLTVKRNNGNYEILVGSLGYKERKLVVMASSQRVSIYLEEDSRNLNEVIVTTDNFLKNVIKKSYEAIDTNYPLSHIELEGFYRETQKSVEGKYLYFGEAAIRLQQSGYGNSIEDAQIQILHARARKFPGRDTIDHVRYYGGVSIGNWNDPVKMKQDFLNPASYNRKYIYYLENVSSYNSGKDTLYTITFQSKNEMDGISGSIAIDKNSMAYRKIQYKENKVSKSNPLSPIKRLKKEYLTMYQLVNEKYVLNYTSMTARRRNSKTQKESIHELEFVTTACNTGNDILASIPVKSRMDPGTIFSEIESTPTENFWDSYTTIVRDSSLKEQTKSVYVDNNVRGIDYQKSNERAPLSNRDKVYRVLKGINLGYSLNGLGFNRHANEAGFVRYQSLEATKKISDSRFSPALTVSIGYALNRVSSVRLDITNSVLKRDLLDIKRLSYSRYFLIKEFGNPIFLSAGAGASWMKSGQRYGELKTNSRLLIKNRDFGNRAAVYLGNKGIQGYVEAGVEYRKGKYSYFITGGYSPVFTKDAYVIIQHRKTFLLPRKNG